MTDEEIIKGLETEIELAEYVDSYTADNVKVDLLKNALNLIEMQQEKIEKLQKTQQVQANRIIEERGRKYELTSTVSILNKQIKTAKSEAIRDFAKYLIDKSENGLILTSDIPDLVKEMTEVKDNGKV